MGAGMARWKGLGWRRLATLVLPLALVGAAAPAPTRDAAGNRLIALTPVKGPAWFAAKDDERSALVCTPDRQRCVRAVKADKDWALEVYDRVPAKPEPAVTIAITGEAEPNYLVPWTHIVAQPDGHWLVGAELTQSAYYSGGGASNTTLTLYDVAPGATTEPPAVLSTLVGGSVMIRACFGERDTRDRAGACHDRYDFNGTLTIDPANRADRPRFRIVTAARTYPGRLFRNDDNTQKRLTKRGLTWVRDPVCSYTRTFAWTGKEYAPDRPEPDCSQYLAL